MATEPAGVEEVRAYDRAWLSWRDETAGDRRSPHRAFAAGWLAASRHWYGEGRGDRSDKLGRCGIDSLLGRYVKRVLLDGVAVLAIEADDVAGYVDVQAIEPQLGHGSMPRSLSRRFYGHVQIELRADTPPGVLESARLERGW